MAASFFDTSPGRAVSPIGMAAWIDLRRHLRDERVSELRGSPTKREIGGKSYWYDAYRVGDQVVKKYIGPDSEELRARLDNAGAIRARAKDDARERSRLMRILRAEGFLTADVVTGRIILAMSRAGVFRLGGTLIGTQAFRCYEGELGRMMSSDRAALTDDIDIASFERLSIALEDQVSEPLTKAFDELKFEPLPSLEKGRVWRWAGSERRTLVEFLTPSFSAGEGLRDLPALGVSAQSLHYLNYLIAEPIEVPFLYRDGALVQVPRPERFAIHKLIVADRRRESAGDGDGRQKAEKDRAQADYLIRILAEERPFDLLEAYRTARETGTRWQARLDASLARMPQTRAILEALG